jgi:hypothetical protein
MEQLATPGTVLLTANTLRLAEGYVTAKPLGSVPVKGLEAPMEEVYELTGAGPLRSRLHAVAARGLTRFVGGEGELDHLRQALAVQPRATVRWSPRGQIAPDLTGPHGIHRREVRIRHHDLVAQSLEAPGHPFTLRRGLEQDPGSRPATQHLIEPLGLSANAAFAQLAVLAEDAADLAFLLVQVDPT